MSEKKAGMFTCQLKDNSCSSSNNCTTDEIIKYRVMKKLAGFDRWKPAGGSCIFGSEHEAETFITEEQKKI
ncbi:hypothetical protein [Abyssogena phaseoliformis symbiont]|uniref:hypothetical protein n=1 Tax=Abyssogena phaseoliformis symbiont TaxID=596095 RepID=UPI0019169E5D|nr:hypothetical protein [Abyssogena phaseoliformis symbiont]